MPHPAQAADGARRAAIVGAGMAGLTAALALSAKGWSVDLLERAPRLDAAGAGIQLSPNATRILERLGVTEALGALWLEPDEIRLVDGRDLATRATVPAGAFARRRWGAPYAVIARTDLQRALLDAVLAAPLCRLHLNSPIADATIAAVTRVTGRTPQLIVGADGMASQVRAAIGGAPARFSGHVAWRFTLAPGANLPPPFAPGVVAAYLGRKAHLVAYPMGRAGGLNLVLIGGGALATERAAGDAGHGAAVAALLAGWHPALRAALAAAEPLGVWPLHAVADGPWRDGARILIGDAAHAMMPFAAQGAAMAIEDAAALADALDAPGEIAPALDAFVAARKVRIARVRARGAFNRFAYHASGPARMARDMILSLRAPESLARDFDWLYGYGADGRHL